MPNTKPDEGEHMSRKPLAALAASVTILVAAGVALAHGSPGTMQSVSASFDATTVSNLVSRTCTGGDGTYTMTKATYTGAAASDDTRLNGTLTVKARTVYNATTNLGVVDGKFRVEGTNGRSEGHFRAVDNNGTLTGWTDGHVGGPHAKLLGSLAVDTFDPATGFQGAQLGTGSPAGAALLVTGGCQDSGHGDRSHGSKGKHNSKKHGRKHK
jgi:hypothetical protein